MEDQASHAVLIHGLEPQAKKRAAFGDALEVIPLVPYGL
jgi:hypothetical protein